jgi:hypothetical protein
MPVIHFQLLSISDAEEAVVEIWRILEEYNIPSPAMTCMCRGSSQVKIALRVDNVMDAQTLMVLLGATGWDAEQLHGARREMQSTRCPHGLGSRRTTRRGRSPTRRRRPSSSIRTSTSVIGACRGRAAQADAGREFSIDECLTDTVAARVGELAQPVKESEGLQDGGIDSNSDARISLLDTL